MPGLLCAKSPAPNVPFGLNRVVVPCPCPAIVHPLCNGALIYPAKANVPTGKVNVRLDGVIADAEPRGVCVKLLINNWLSRYTFALVAVTDAAVSSVNVLPSAEILVTLATRDI